VTQPSEPPSVQVDPTAVIQEMTTTTGRMIMHLIHDLAVTRAALTDARTDNERLQRLITGTEAPG
jgi:hypothetical protein